MEQREKEINLKPLLLLVAMGLVLYTPIETFIVGSIAFVCLTTYNSFLDRKTNKN